MSSMDSVNKNAFLDGSAVLILCKKRRNDRKVVSSLKGSSSIFL